MINGFINSINWATVVLSTLAPGVHIPKNTEPATCAARRGGTATKSTLAMIGEGSELRPLIEVSQFLKNSGEREALAHHSAAIHLSNKPKLVVT